MIELVQALLCVFDHSQKILQFQDKVPYTLGSDLIEFARAILRKAQEK